MNILVIIIWIINLCIICITQDVGYLRFMAVLGSLVIILNSIRFRM